MIFEQTVNAGPGVIDRAGREANVEPETKFFIVGAFMFAAILLWPNSALLAIIELIVAVLVAYALAEYSGRS